LPQLLSFTPCDLYSHIRPTPALHGRPANGNYSATESDIAVKQKDPADAGFQDFIDRSTVVQTTTEY